MPLPGRVAESVRRALEERGHGSRIERIVDLGGGCINHAARVETDTGATAFLKWNASAPPGMFEAEAEGLRAIAGTGELRAPAPIAWLTERSGPSWLLLEYVAPGGPSREAETRLGAGLARIHTSISEVENASYGWPRDNWIGTLPQGNAPLDSWADFWRDRRIVPQLDRARGGGRLADGVFDRLLDVIARALADVVLPELVHGDLWSGNWFTSSAGEPVLIDPAVYRGHGEVDLAMSELFGGFGPRFYDAYRDAHGISDGYAAYRRDLYQLYYLLVHVNLFGPSYEAGSLRAARRVVAELSA